MMTPFNHVKFSLFSPKTAFFEKFPIFIVSSINQNIFLNFLHNLSTEFELNKLRGHSHAFVTIKDTNICEESLNWKFCLSKLRKKTKKVFKNIFFGEIPKCK